MLYEQENDEITISPHSSEESPIQIYENKSDDVTTNNKQIEMNFDTFNTNVAISVGDIMSKVNIFLNIYGDRMRQFRKEKPTTWGTILERARKQYTESKSSLDDIIELIAALSIEYEAVIQEDNTKNIIRSAIVEYTHSDKSNQ